MLYPPEFTAEARARVEAERIAAKREFEQARRVEPPAAWKRPKRIWDCCAHRTYILRVVAAFGREACELGRKRLWTIDRVRAAVDQFLRNFATLANREDGRDRFGEEFPAVVSEWAGGFLPDVEREFKDSDEWRCFEDELLEVARGQADSPPKVSPNRDDAKAPLFRDGETEYPNLLARWDMMANRWTILDYAIEDRGEPDQSQKVPADVKGLELLKQSARDAVRLLHNSGDERISDLTRTLRDPLSIWLDLMRENGRGFRYIPQMISWNGGRPLQADLESGGLALID